MVESVISRWCSRTHQIPREMKVSYSSGLKTRWEATSYMELDTGATVSLVSEQTWLSLFPGSSLKPSRNQLRTYLGETISVLGQLDVVVSYDRQEARLPLVVVKGTGPSLFGRNWLEAIRLEAIRLDRQSINAIASPTPLEQVLEQHKAIFDGGLGKLRGHLAKIHVDPGA